MKAVFLSQGYMALVDDGDYEYALKTGPWCALVCSKTVYARRTLRSPLGQKSVYLHKVLLGITDSTIVDHKDRNGLNCQRSNLRIVTRAENNRNAGLRKDNTSGYKGVTFCRDRKKWAAQILVNHDKKHLGYFATKEEAAQAYDFAALNLFGGFACTNKMLGLLQEDEELQSLVDDTTEES